MNPVRRETIITVLVAMAVSLCFIFAVYLPGQKTSLAARQEIAAGNKSIQELPLRVAELTSLKQDVQSHQDYVDRNRKRLSRVGDLYRVIRDVADLARNSHLEVTRLEPLAVVSRASYQIAPYRISLSGEFAGVNGFLHGLEQQQRLVSVEQLSLKGEDGQTAKSVTGDMYFSVYLHPAESNGFAKNADSAEAKLADRG